MVRLFPAIAAADCVLLISAATFGFLVRGNHLYAQHFGLALFAALFTLLVHVIVITYFSATGRMISQAVFIGHLDRSPLEKVKKGKSRAFRCVALGVFALLAVVALGALTARDPRFATAHWLVAMLTICANAAAFLIQYQAIAAHTALVAEVLDRYQSRNQPTGEAPTPQGPTCPPPHAEGGD